MREKEWLFFLHRVLQDINSALELDEVLVRIMDGATRLLDAECGSILLLDEEEGELRIKVAKGLSKKIVEQTRIKPEEGISGYVFVKGEPLLVKNIETHPLFCKKSHERYYTKSLLSCPLHTKGKVIGVININNKKSKESFVEHDLRMLQALADGVVVALENSKLWEEKKRQLEDLHLTKKILSQVNELLDRKLYELTIINKVSQEVASFVLDYYKVIRAVMEVVKEVIEHHSCGLLLVEEEEAFLEVTLFDGVRQDYISRVQDALLSQYQGCAKRKLEKKKIKMHFEKKRVCKDGHTQPQSQIVLPLKVAQRAIGAMGIFHPQSNFFTEEDHRLFCLIRDHSSIVIENALLHKEVEELSITDGLTKLYVHRHFHECLRNELARARRYNRPLSICMLDIDYFKEYNDTYGHLAGDKVLKEVARIIKENARSMDIVARYGGEEFAMVLPECSKEQAIKIAERIKQKVREQRFLGQETQPHGVLTVSAGVASFPEDGATNTALLEKADTALYKAKHYGRDRICY